MEEFNLEKALSGDYEVITREREVISRQNWHYFDIDSARECIAYLNSNGVLLTVHKNGRHLRIDENRNKNDLLIRPIKKKYYVSVMKRIPDGYLYSCAPREKLQDAIDNENDFTNSVLVTRIEFEA